MAFRFVVQGQRFEADTLAELQALRQMLDAGVSPPPARQWDGAAAAEYLSMIIPDDRLMLAELLRAGDGVYPLTAMAIYLKRPASYFNTMLRRIEHFSRRLGVTAPVTKVRQRGGFVLSLNTDFAQAYSAIRSP